MKNITLKVKKIKAIPYQVCPLCKGDGTIFMTPIINGTSVTTGSHTCDVCGGARIIPMYVIPRKQESPSLPSM